MSGMKQLILFSDEELYILDKSPLSIRSRSWAKKHGVYDLNDDIEMDSLINFIDTFAFSSLEKARTIDKVSKLYDLNLTVTMLAFTKIEVDTHSVYLSYPKINIKSEVDGLAKWQVA